MSNLQFEARPLCAGGSIFSDKCSVSNTFDYQLACFPENGLSFLYNNHDAEDPNYHLYYNWADVDNYGDVDDMYRSSDSTCGLSSRHGDGLGWFSLSDAVGGTQDALNVPCSASRSRKRMFENDDTFRLDCMTHSSSVSNLRESSAIEGSSCFLGDENSSRADLLTFSKDSSCRAEQNKKPKCQTQLASSMNQLVENDSKPFGYLQGDTPYTSSVYYNSSDTSLNESLNVMQSENSSITSLSLHDLYALDGTHSMKGSMESFQKVVSSASGDTRDQTKNECSRDVNVSISAESDGSGWRENSESFKFDDISAGANSFRQLQLVMNQLDPRTKLCIRDSLYRLAWSAEQRQYYESLDSGFIDDRYSMLTEGINMNMDLETDTNPIDRSIAHLLFHRAADQSVLAG